MPPITLANIAAAARVDRSTVSLALRNHPRIPLTTRTRIRGIAERLGYRPNPLITALMRSRRRREDPLGGTLAFLTSHPTRDGWRKDRAPIFFSGAERRAHQLGFRLEPFWLLEPDMRPERLGRILLARNIHGVLVNRPGANQRILTFPWKQFACVVLGVIIEQPAADRVAHNQFEDARLAYAECLARGYRRIGLCVLSHVATVAIDRWIGGVFSQQRHQRASAHIPPFLANEPRAGTFVEWLDRYRPDAIVSGEADQVARLLRGAGRKLPGDVAVAALNLAEYDGTIGGVFHDPNHAGAQAIDLLVSALYRNVRGLPEEPSETLLRGSWVDGKTVPAKDTRKEFPVRRTGDRSGGADRPGS